MPYNLLSEPIRKYVRDKRWEQLRPIQSAAITRIMASDDNFILASRTASGKTEAAFLPILSKVDFSQIGVQVLYISPLIALINDQFNRVEELCKHLDISVTKWHGEANRTEKERLLKTPNGIVLITPESIEAMFVNKPYNVKQLFSNLKYVVVDEIHSFIGSDRGIQLKSLLYRLQQVNVDEFSIIGLSATIGDYLQAKEFTGKPERTTVLLDKSSKEIVVDFRYFKNETIELPLDLLKDLYLETRLNKALIFPNSRGKTEEISVKLKKISERVGGHSNYFSHHSSVNKEVREYVEYFAKNNQRNYFCVACTSTLELGIDIGSVDKVIQIDATHSVASLIQRLGRSGRKDGELSRLVLYATNPWELLQSISCMELYNEGIIDPPEVIEKPYDILLHQTLSIVKGYSGISSSHLIDKLCSNFAFCKIGRLEIEEIIHHLISNNILEQIDGEIIIGLDGERIVNSREFYTVFKNEENFKVVSGSNVIGEVPYSPQIVEGENIFLAAKVWKITYIDMRSKKIEAVSTKDGKKPIFFGNGANVHSIIREKMLSLVMSEKSLDYLDGASSYELNELRKYFSAFSNNNGNQRPLIPHDFKCQLYTFEGTKVNRALALMLKLQGISNVVDERNSEITMEITSNELMSRWSRLTESVCDIDLYLRDFLKSNPNIINFSKWGYLLPDKYQVELLKCRYYDFNNAVYFIQQVYPQILSGT